MALMIRSKQAQKMLEKIIGKPDAMKRKPKTMMEKMIADKSIMSGYYKRSYSITKQV